MTACRGSSRLARVEVQHYANIPHVAAVGEIFIDSSKIEGFEPIARLEANPWRPNQGNRRYYAASAAAIWATIAFSS